MLVYIWSRRNPFVRMNFFGLLNFQVRNSFFPSISTVICMCIAGLCLSWNQPKLLICLIQAPYLPWVLLGFSVLLGNAIWVDLIGMAVGHMYYFAEDVFPRQNGGFRILKTPQILWVESDKTLICFHEISLCHPIRSNKLPCSSDRKTLFDAHTEDPNYTPLPEDRPGGFNWGQGANVQWLPLTSTDKLTHYYHIDHHPGIPSRSLDLFFFFLVFSRDISSDLFHPLELDACTILGRNSNMFFIVIPPIA